MIAACELAMSGGAHVPFNAGMLATIRAAYPGEELLFLGTPSHIAEVRRQLGEDLAGSLAWIPIAAPGPGLTYWRRFSREMRILSSLGRVIGREPRGRLLLTSSYPSTLVAAQLLERTRLRHLTLQAVVHGGLSGVAGRRHRHPLRRFEEMRTALTLRRRSRIRYLVLEESMREFLLAGVPALEGRVDLLEHPLPPNEGEADGTEFTRPVRFGFLGLASEAKGFPLFCRLAEQMTGKLGRDAEFHVVGRWSSERGPSPTTAALATRPVSERLSRAEFVRGVKALHFTVLPYEPGYYDMSATGTLLDAIAWKKPLVARRIPVFENMFREYGDIGYLFADEAELQRIVGHIVEAGDQVRYRTQVSNLSAAETARRPEQLAARYRQICAS